eukprot:SAG22_NODE_1870_length_3401_cov_5.551484_2_plen_333_part_00
MRCAGGRARRPRPCGEAPSAPPSTSASHCGFFSWSCCCVLPSPPFLAVPLLYMVVQHGLTINRPDPVGCRQDPTVSEQACANLGRGAFALDLKPAYLQRLGKLGACEAAVAALQVRPCLSVVLPPSFYLRQCLSMLSIAALQAHGAADPDVAKQVRIHEILLAQLTSSCYAIVHIADMDYGPDVSKQAASLMRCGAARPNTVSPRAACLSLSFLAVLPAVRPCLSLRFHACPAHRGGPLLRCNRHWLLGYSRRAARRTRRGWWRPAAVRCPGLPSWTPAPPVSCLLTGVPAWRPAERRGGRARGWQRAPAAAAAGRVGPQATGRCVCAVRLY